MESLVTDPLSIRQNVESFLRLGNSDDVLRQSEVFETAGGSRISLGGIKEVCVAQALEL